MARRPENPRNRGRRSEGPLDWLNLPDDKPGQPDPRTGPAPAVDAWRPQPGDHTRIFPPAPLPPAPLSPTPRSAAPQPRAERRPRPDPGAGTDPRPHADPTAPAPPVLGRRAARAQREAQQAEALQSGALSAGALPAERTRAEQAREQERTARARAEQEEAARLQFEHEQREQARQRQAGQQQAGQQQAGPVWEQAPADRTRIGQAWNPAGTAAPATAAPGTAAPGTAAPGTAAPGTTPTARPGRTSGTRQAARARAAAADQTQVGQAWNPAPAPPVEERPLAGHHAPPLVRDRSRTPPAGQRQRAQPTDDHSEAPPIGDDGPGTGRAKEPRTGPRRRRVAIWLTVAALLLALWSATSFIDSGNVAVAGLAAIAPLVSIIALPVIAVGVASRHIVPTAIAVVAALLPWTLVTGYASTGPGRYTVGTDSTMRVMSVDGAAGRASAKDIVQVTRLYEVDVVVVTELTSELAHELTVAGLNALAPSRWVNVPSSGQHGTGMWARPQVSGLTPITGLSRPGVDGVIEAGATRIGISVVHLAGKPLQPGPDWRSDLSELSSRTPPADQSFIVGDLNASPWQPAFRKLTGSNWRDAADVIGQGLRPTWPSWSPIPIAPVDHVLVTPKLGVTGADTTNIAGSTHRALIVTLVLPHAGG